MHYIKPNVTLSCNDKNSTPEEKLLELEQELIQLQDLSEEDEDLDYYLDNVKFGKSLTKYEPGMREWKFDEYLDTNINPLFLVEGIDIDELTQALEYRLLSNPSSFDVSVPDRNQLDNFDKLNDVMTIDNNPRDKKKFFVFNTPGYVTKYHSLPGGGMISTLVKSNSPYIRKVIWNEEGNFEEIISDDKPDWLLEIESNEEERQFEISYKHSLKVCWRALEKSREMYKTSYARADFAKEMISISEGKMKEKRKRIEKINREKGNEAYKTYKECSELIDKAKAIEAKEKNEQLEKDAGEILHYFVEFQRVCPDEYLECVVREDIKDKYKKEGYSKTITYLEKLIKRSEELNAKRKN